MALWLYPNFFLNSMASGNLQHSITSRESFPIIKIPFLPSKYALYIFVFFLLKCFFFAIILFNSSQDNLSDIWMSYLSSSITHFMPQINYIFFFVAMLHCCNTPFSPCFFWNYSTTILYIHKKNNKFFLNNFWLFPPIKVTRSFFRVFILKIISCINNIN